MSWRSIKEDPPKVRGRYLVALMKAMYLDDGKIKWYRKCANFDPINKPHWKLGGHPLRSLIFWHELPEGPQPQEEIKL